ncbi:MAG: KH domain-containing protein [Syntrophobacteraceae bacterium]|jgi:predicted RNA-binding protein YlqC (UPF0109 family)
MLKELIETMVTALVDNPNQVEVSEIEGGMASAIVLRVAKADLGKVIGKLGRNVDAMRTFLIVASTKIRKRVILEIIVRKRTEEISN